MSLRLSFHITQYKIMSFFFLYSGSVISIDLIITVTVFYDVCVFSVIQVSYAKLDLGVQLDC